MEKINLSDLLEPEHMDPVKRIALIRIVDDDGGVRESYKFLILSSLADFVSTRKVNHCQPL